MSLKDIDLGAALRRLADRRIEEAMKEGKFDNLRGAGQDIVLDDIPIDEDARMTWWCLRILRNNDFTPEEVRWRKLLDHLHEALARMDDEPRLIALVGQINKLVRQINTLGTNALKAPVAPLDVDAELARLRARLGGKK